MPKTNCRKCNKKVSGPKVTKGTFVGDSKNFHKTLLGQQQATTTSQAEHDTDEA